MLVLRDEDDTAAMSRFVDAVVVAASVPRSSPGTSTKKDQDMPAHIEMTSAFTTKTFSRKRCTDVARPCEASSLSLTVTALFS